MVRWWQQKSNLRKCLHFLHPTALQIKQITPTTTTTTSKRGIVLPDVKKRQIEHRGPEDSANVLCLQYENPGVLAEKTLVTRTPLPAQTYRGRQRCWPAGWASCVSGRRRSRRWWRWCSSRRARSAAGTRTPPAWRTESRSRSRPRWCCTWARRDKAAVLLLDRAVATLFLSPCLINHLANCTDLQKTAPFKPYVYSRLGTPLSFYRALK